MSKLRFTLLLLLAGCSAARIPHPAPPPTPTPPSGPATVSAANDWVQSAAAQPVATPPGTGWHPLFDGHSLAGWQVTEFAGRGEVTCDHGLVVLGMGDPFTGLNWTNSFPTLNYEVALEAMRVTGSDFFCGLTVPVGESFCSLIVGGWGGSLVGISSLDGMDASENETTKYQEFQKGRWYRIRLRVTAGRIEGWIDDDKLVDVVTTGKQISLRPGDIELSKPFGICSWQTTAALRALQLRSVSSPADRPKRTF